RLRGGEPAPALAAVPRGPRHRGPGAGDQRPARRDNPFVTNGAPRMVFLGFGKYARADRIYALEPLGEGERGHGRRTRVWIDGIAEPIVASRTERTILHDMGQEAAAVGSPLIDDALDLAGR